MGLLTSLLMSSIAINVLLIVNMLLLKSENTQIKKVLDGTLMEKGRLRNIIRKMNQN